MFEISISHRVLAVLAGCALAALPTTGSAKELGDFVRAESAKWGTVIQTSGIKLD